MNITISRFYRRFRGEIIISTISLILSMMGSVIITVSFSTYDPYLIGGYFLGSFVTISLLVLPFIQKRLFEKRFQLLNQVLVDYLGFTARENQFFMRRAHYAPEKELLSQTLVRTTLPKIVEQICKSNSNLTTLNIIIDSGTTLTPIFPKLVTFGLPVKESVTVNIYTNSMSGIEEIHKFESEETSGGLKINLIGGQPLSKYRATTGEVTQSFLQDLWKRQKEAEKGTILTLSVLTANWFLAGSGFDSICLCARGAGHLEFKSDVSNHSDYRILVSPLGKILSFRDVSELNGMLNDPSDEYRSYHIPPEYKDTTYLLTTLRDQHTLSPFRQLSIRLERLRETARNFVLCTECPNFDPPGHTRKEVFVNETPHKYVRDNFVSAYGFDPPSG